MTKADIFNRIERQCDAQREVGTMLNELIKLPSVGADATIIATLLNTINVTIFDTITTLSLILFEMMPDKEG